MCVRVSLSCPARCCQRHAEFTVERVGRIPGLNVVVPKGAMYMMVRSRRRNVAPASVVVLLSWSLVAAALAV